MDARELRIGNLAYDDEGALIVLKSISDLTERWEGEEVTRVLYDIIVNNKRQGYYECDLELLTPVDFEEEWLLKLGFECEHKEGNQEDFKVYKLGNLTYNTAHKSWWIFNTNKHNVKIEYIHQLQNLYWCLCGEELVFADH